MKTLLLTLSCLLAALPPAQAQAPAWKTDAAASELHFTATFERTPAPGRFRRFDAAVRFDPERLSEGRIDVVIDMASADMANDDVNKEIRGADWFDIARHPNAEFRATELRKAGANAYVAAGTLTVKGIARRVDVPFTWQAGAGDTALMKGELSLQRAAFRIGLGEWAATGTIGGEVKVAFALRLRKGG
jgi:polyisoprenoid-binding protein YceI